MLLSVAAEKRRLEIQGLPCDSAQMRPNSYPSVEVQIIQKMKPAQKLEAFQQLYHLARSLKIAGLKLGHPDWTEAQIQKAVRDIFLYART